MKDISISGLRDFIKKLKEEEKKVKEKIAHAEALLAAMSNSRGGASGRNTASDGIDSLPEIKAIFKAENFRDMKLDEIVNKLKERLGIEYDKARGKVTHLIRKNSLEKGEKYGFYRLNAVLRVEAEQV